MYFDSLEPKGNSLKGTHIWLKEDLSWETEEVRAKLYNHMKAARKADKKTILSAIIHCS